MSDAPPPAGALSRWPGRLAWAATLWLIGWLAVGFTALMTAGRALVEVGGASGALVYRFDPGAVFVLLAFGVGLAPLGLVLLWLAWGTESSRGWRRLRRTAPALIPLLGALLAVVVHAAVLRFELAFDGQGLRREDLRPWKRYAVAWPEVTALRLSEEQTFSWRSRRRVFQRTLEVTTRDGRREAVSLTDLPRGEVARVVALISAHHPLEDLRPR